MNRIATSKEELSHYLDQTWVSENADRLYELIESETDQPETLKTGVLRLLYAFPRLIDQENIRDWVKLMENALRKMRLDYSTKDPLQPEYTLSDTVIIKRMDHSAILVNRKKRQRHRLSPRQMYETYLIMMISLYFEEAIALDDTLIQDMLSFARIVNHSHITFKLYQVLSSVYSQQYHFQESEDYAMMAYQYFRRQNNQLEMAITAHSLAANFYRQRERDATEYWLELAASYYSEENYPRQYGAIASMYGQIAVVDEDYGAAKQWLEIAIEERDAARQPANVANNQHSLGLALTYANEFEAAEEYLESALDYYVRNEDKPREAFVLITVGFNQGRRGKTDAARQTLSEARSIIDSLTDSPWRENQLKQIQMLEDALNDGTIKGLKPEPWA